MKWRPRRRRAATVDKRSLGPGDGSSYVSPSPPVRRSLLHHCSEPRMALEEGCGRSWETFAAEPLVLEGLSPSERPLQSNSHKLTAGSHAHLLKQLMHCRLHRALADYQARRNLLRAVRVER